METDREDVMSAVYKEERTRWVQTSSVPEAYARGNGWGLARVKNQWLLFMLLNSTRAMRQVGVFAAKGNEPPFLWAKGKVAEWEERRKSAKWEEKTITGKPGEEGFSGGRLIPMQIFEKGKA